MAKKKRGRRSLELSKLNIGVVIFLVFLLFLTINLIQYLTKSHLSVYEVQAVSLAQNDQAEAVIIRDETMIQTSEAGYVNYYQKSGTRVKKNETVYSIDDNRSIYDIISKDDASYSLSESDVKAIKQLISDFHDDYGNVNYSEIYDLSDRLTAKIKNISDSFLLEHLNDILSQTGADSSLTVCKTPASGVISYFSDTLDGLTVNDVSPKTFDKGDYEEKNLFSTELKEGNSLVYKLLTNENWTLMLSLSEEQYQQLADYTRLRFCINKDKLWVTQNVTFLKIDDGYFARIDMNKYLVRYLDERFLDVTIDMQAESGLKIPNTAIVEKEFYMIPTSYFTQGGNSEEYGLVMPVYNSQKGELEYELVNTEIYYQDETYSYIDMSTFTYGTYIYNMETEEQFQVSLVGRLEGVYCVNKGYAQFRRIEHLYDGEEYSIVKAGVPLSISEHDHIALDASKIDESQSIY